MRISVKRFDRRGMAPKMMLMLAGAGLLGFMLLKHMKAKHGARPAAPVSTTAASAPAAPESTAGSSREVAVTDPELVRLSASSRSAHDHLASTLAGGDPQQIADAREGLR